MKRSLQSACCLLLLAAVARASVQSETDAVAADKLLARAQLGVQVVRLGTSPADLKELYERQSHVPLVPASNLKLVTTAASIEKLGAAFKFRTQLALADGDLILVGDGDPTFGDSALLKKVGWKPTSVYESWAQQLRQAGITQVRDVIVDDSVFDADFVHPDWPADQLDFYYEAEVAGMSFNANVVDVSVAAGGASPSVSPATKYVTFDSKLGGGKHFEMSREPAGNLFTLRGDPPARGMRDVRTIHDPPLFAATMLSETLDGQGIKVNGKVRRDRTLRDRLRRNDVPGARLVGVHETPLPTVLAHTNKQSANLYAESLCKRMGFDEPRNVSGSWPRGLAAVGDYLRGAGIPDSDYSLQDGCGMSKRNVISPRALVRVLCYEYYGSNRDAYIKSLSVAGVDGTLDDRFAKSDLRKRVFGKSGFVEGVSTLSGFLQAKDQQWFAFSIMINGIPRLSNGQVKLLQERIVKAVDAQVGR